MKGFHHTIAREVAHNRQSPPPPTTPPPHSFPLTPVHPLSQTHSLPKIHSQHGPQPSHSRRTIQPGQQSTGPILLVSLLHSNTMWFETLMQGGVQHAAYHTATIAMPTSQAPDAAGLTLACHLIISCLLWLLPAALSNVTRAGDPSH